MINLYVETGVTFVEKLHGEFVIAIWNSCGDKLHLITDRFRIHPLFYYQDMEKIVFASRIRSILACPLVIEKTIDLQSIADFTSSSAIPTPKTIFHEIKKVPPGSILTFYGKECAVDAYWDVNFLEQHRTHIKELRKQLKVCFRDAISSCLSEESTREKIGTFLSGGIDSSTVTGELTELLQSSIKTFSIGFQEDPYNELHYSRVVSKAFNTIHYEYIVTPEDAYNAIDVLRANFDEPFGNASAIPVYYCAWFAKQNGVEALFAGDGGDELFAGNERYATQRLFDYYGKIPKWLREAMKPFAFYIANQMEWNIFVKLNKYILRASIPYPQRLYSYGFFKAFPPSDFFSKDFLQNIGPGYNPDNCVDYYYHKAQAESELERQLYVDLKLVISDNDLIKVTRMTEAAGVTVRYPFLDHHVANFAASIPSEIKMRGLELRSFFKKSYADLLPAETRKKKKHGFGLPVHIWLRNDRRLREMMMDLVLSTRSISRGYFQKRGLEQIVSNHQNDETAFYGTMLWNLMILELWHRDFVDGEEWKHVDDR
jgi:asparagine synthase (glutamine-hydrolysing)